jgi:hypothetical protein
MSTQPKLWKYLALMALLALTGCASLGQEAEPAADPPPRHDLDDVADVAVSGQRVELVTPVTMNIDGRLTQVSRLVELVVTSAEPIPARALDPVLVVGDRVVHEYRYEAANRLVFTEPEPDKLKSGAKVRFQWGLKPSADQIIATDFVFEPASLPEVRR